MQTPKSITTLQAGGVVVVNTTVVVKTVVVVDVARAAQGGIAQT
jgi:hypothetical protein